MEEEYHELNLLFWPPVYYYHVRGSFSFFLFVPAGCAGLGGFLVYLLVLHVLHMYALHHLLGSFQAQAYTEFSSDQDKYHRDMVLVIFCTEHFRFP